MKFLTDLISGILGFIGSLFQPKKKGFYLEYEGDAAPAEAPNNAEAQAAASPDVAVAPALATVATEASAPEVSAAAGTKTKTKKSARSAKLAEAASVAVTVAASIATPAPALQVATTPAAPTISYADVVKNPTSGPAVSRRRPGVNMSGFLAMAAEVGSR